MIFHTGIAKSFLIEPIRKLIGKREPRSTIDIMKDKRPINTSNKNALVSANTLKTKYAA
jgi:hypothetical protein